LKTLHKIATIDDILATRLRIKGRVVRLSRAIVTAKITEIDEWCTSNCIGDWNKVSNYEWQFSEERDAVIFCLRWI
jgi:hypothetical protein